jgi:hypothetical protein
MRESGPAIFDVLDLSNVNSTDYRLQLQMDLNSLGEWAFENDSN